jgi:hypothetical protein
MEDRYGKLTDSEKVIFSTFYAMKYPERRRKFYNREDECDTAASVVEDAIAIIMLLRRSVSTLREHYGKKYADVVLQIVNDESS